MDIAIVTGAETPLGLRLVQSLVQQGCRVHGIGNNFSKVNYADPLFRGHAVDLTDTAAAGTLLEQILEKEQRLDILIHAIDVTPGTPFGKLPPGNLEAILKIGLLGPVMLTRLALPNLQRFRGQLINVLTSNKNGHPSSAVNALVEGGLREMNRALFDASRDSGLRMTNCILRQNARLPGAQVSDAVLEQAHIDLEDVARTIEQLIDPKVMNIPSEIVLHPRLSPDAEEALAESPLEVDTYSAVVLPPKAYCPPEEPKIPTAEKQTVDRSIPYTDEEMEDKIAAAIEDFEAHPERYERADTAPPRKQEERSAHPDGRPGQSKRRRRRSGRNRNKRREGGESSGESGQSSPQQEDKQRTGGTKQHPEQRNERDKNQPTQNQVSAGNLKPEPHSEPKEKSGRADLPPQTKKPVDEASPEKKAAKKSPSKKAAKKTAAKKAAKKTAKKKNVAKKAVKKRATKKSQPG